MNLTFSIANSKIKDNKYDFLAEKFDHTLLLSEKKIVKSTYKYKQKETTSFEDNIDMNIQNFDFI